VTSAVAKSGDARSWFARLFSRQKRPGTTSPLQQKAPAAPPGTDQVESYPLGSTPQQTLLQSPSSPTLELAVSLSRISPPGFEVVHESRAPPYPPPTFSIAPPPGFEVTHASVPPPLLGDTPPKHCSSPPMLPLHNDTTRCLQTSPAAMKFAAPPGFETIVTSSAPSSLALDGRTPQPLDPPPGFEVLHQGSSPPLLHDETRI